MEPEEGAMIGCGRVGALCIGLAIVAMSCAPPSRPEAPGSQPAAPSLQFSPKWVTAAFLSDPPSLVNRVNSAVAGGRTSAGINQIGDLLNTGLVVPLDRGVLHPRLAEAVPSIENGLWRVFPDGRTETIYRIKDGVQWHDGTPFTAEDLVFSARVAQDRELPFVRILAYDLIDQVEIIDPRTAVVKWKRPFI